MTKRSSHRNSIPAEFIIHIKYWRGQKDYQDIHTAKEWKIYISSEGLAVGTANKYTRMAYCLLPDPNRDEYLRHIAYLHIPRGTLDKACSDKVTDLQRHHFFSKIEDLRGERISQKVAEEILDEVLNPPVIQKPKLFPDTQKEMRQTLHVLLEQVDAIKFQIEAMLA